MCFLGATSKQRCLCGIPESVCLLPQSWKYLQEEPSSPLGSSSSSLLACCVGLQPNETYTFAVAAYDAQHKLISELGQSAGPVAALLPLPLYHCWCHLALTAAQLHVTSISHLAADVVLPHFIVTQPDCPVWVANPLDRQDLDRSAVCPGLQSLKHIVT